jgi:hypothetical protein
MPKAAVNGIEIHYEIEGRGDPVMLLVGLPGVGKGPTAATPLRSMRPTWPRPCGAWGVVRRT